MKRKFFGISKIVVSIVTIPMWFVKIFVQSSSWRDSAGNLNTSIHAHSMFDNIVELQFHIVRNLRVPVFAYVTITLSVASALLSFAALRSSDNKKLFVISNVVFFFDVTIFLTLLFFTSLIVWR